ncbi:MAG: helix-turn-helix domain-containing protein [bacterium]|nr:helix-turn-helix domain-containing protein [bacterium]
MESETQEQLRKQTIRLWRKGKKYLKIADIVGASENAVGKLVRKYKKYGAKSLQAKKTRSPL